MPSPVPHGGRKTEICRGVRILHGHSTLRRQPKRGPHSSHVEFGPDDARYGQLGRVVDVGETTRSSSLAVGGSSVTETAIAGSSAESSASRRSRRAQVLSAAACGSIKALRTATKRFADHREAGVEQHSRAEGDALLSDGGEARVYPASVSGHTDFVGTRLPGSDTAYTRTGKGTSGWVVSAGGCAAPQGPDVTTMITAVSAKTPRGSPAATHYRRSEFVLLTRLAFTSASLAAAQRRATMRDGTDGARLRP